MRVLVAGATGAIGRPLVAALNAHGHAVAGLTIDANAADVLSSLGAQPLVVDVLDRDATAPAVLDARPDVVVEQLTALPRSYTPELMRAALAATGAVRTAVATTSMQPRSPRGPTGTSRSPAVTTTGPEMGWPTRVNRGSSMARRWLPGESPR